MKKRGHLQGGMIRLELANIPLILYSKTMPTISGTEVSESLNGTSGDDVIYGYGGDDAIRGYGGSDLLYGGEGNDIIYGGNRNDLLKGGEGDDRLYGNDGNDTLDGGTGFDYLWGGDGDDTYIINSKTFYLWDSDGNDTAIVNADFVKIPSFIENVTYTAGVQALPYWISALLAEYAARYSSLLGVAKTFNFGFPDTIPDYASDDPEDSNNWESFNAAQRIFTRSVFEYIASIVDITFTEVTTIDAVNTFSFANNSQDNSGAYGKYPSSSSSGSDVYVDKEWDDGSAKTGSLQPRQGEYAAYLWMHEIGHSLGLKHPFDEANVSGDVGPPPYLQENEDRADWTVMSYNYSPNDYYIRYSPLDIAALQYLYGPNPASRAGDDTYTFDPANANFIWDGAGTDTIDASGAEEKVTVYLEPGYWGFKGDAKADTITSNGQITVNFGTKIENLIGSNFGDHLVGNELNNQLTGNAGNDSIDGSTGIDTAIYGNSLSEFILTKGTDSWAITKSDESDSLVNIERLQFTDTNVALDLDGNAGKTAKLLGAILGAEGVSNKVYVGAGLYFLDGGMTYEELMQAALDVVLGANPSSSSVVDLIWTNIVGPPTPADNLPQYSALIDNGTYTAAELAVAAADHSLNTTNIDLVGLSQTGLEYDLYG
ncbi:MAG: M10 family metallopeptidase C-terminal domain-containing protein [Pseudohongiellaceae bacterium]